MIDLHVHSTFSDGSMTPEELVAEAARTGISALALTDHDSTDGIDRFLAASQKCGIRGIPGVEISADVAKGTLHMLGYFIHHKDERLNDVLRKIRDGRGLRNQKIMRKINALGFHLTWEDVKGFAREDFVGRLHFAQAMVARGYVKDRYEAFDKYLGKGKPAYTERFRLSPEESIRVIREAGGIPVLAHPSTLEMDRHSLRDFLFHLQELGLRGMEVYYIEHTAQHMREYGALARDVGLVATGGTDFHGSGIPGVSLGSGRGTLRVPAHVVDDLMAHLVV